MASCPAPKPHPGGGALDMVAARRKAHTADRTPRARVSSVHSLVDEQIDRPAEVLLDIPLAPDQAAHLSFVVALDIKERGEGPLAIADGNLVALFAAILVFASMLLDAFAIEDLIGAPVLLAGYRDIPGRPI